MAAEYSIDSLLPAEMARKAETIGVAKSNARAYYLFTLAILAGAFISLGAVYATTVFSGGMAINTAEGAKAYTSALPYGLTRMLGGMVFSLGLIMVVIGGAELFTGNVMILMAWASRKVTTNRLMRNWGIVYAGNFVGALLTAGLVFLSGQYLAGNGAVGLTALNIAKAKTVLEFWPAVASGILCNALVCMAVWMSYSARTSLEKVAVIIFPISAFVAAGFEHSIANMFFIPIGLLVKDFAAPEFWTLIGKTSADFASLTWSAFILKNLLPVTIGNIIGGGGLVASVYWIAYLWKAENKAAALTVAPVPAKSGD